MATAERRSPNVILVVTDDQGFGDVARHGNRTIETPHMDRLHDDSARLTDFHVSPTCAPTRAALMTGRYDNRTGVWHTVMGRSLLDREETTMADVFAESGYRTGIFGKWHLGDNYPFRPGDRGFEDVLVHGGGGVAQTPDYWGNDYFDDTYFRDGDPESTDGYCTDVWFEEASKFIESNASEDRPFFCYVPTNAPHGPWQVPDEYLDRYIDDVPEDVARFYAMITNIDDNLGRLRERLGDLGIADETVLIFMSDNGSSCPYYNAGMRGQKGSPYEGGHRVPCFVHWSNRIEDETVETLAAGYDLLPTLVDLCGIEEPDVEFDGQSLRPFLEGADTTPPDRTVFVDSQRVEWPEKWKDSAVLTDRWRLVRGEMLYDIEADPGQAEDVADDHPDVVAELRRDYEEWWDDVGPFQGYSRIVVGTDEEDPVQLTCHDWHECETTPWNQGQILEGEAANGFWALGVANPGEYEIELRRWPAESGAPIDGLPTELTEIDYGSPGGGWTAHAESIDPDTAGILIGGTERTNPVPHETAAVTFVVDVEDGPVELQAWFEDDGEEHGAYFVSVSKV
ncbi:arylsulfatase [Halococcus agarilyticus]|uniref:arylsulfatase n=1 Tax=Halococcus agarilyticus TaxID=1232219 RepID=UPI000677C917|nr:arylsulfatase [Halococcus agarilyticus]